MDLDRNFRFLVPPLTLFFSLLWRAFFYPQLTWMATLSLVSEDPIGKTLSILLGGGIALFALGFLVTSVTTTLLPFVFGKDYEGKVGDNALHRIRESIHLNGMPPDEDAQYPNRVLTVHYYAHTTLQRDARGVFDWLNRRWNMFMTSLNSGVALLASLLLALIDQVRYCYWQWEIFLFWYLPILLLILILFRNGVRARNENRAMVNFLARNGLPQSSSST